MNKTKLLEIAQALDLGSIDDEKARTLLFGLLSVGGSACQFEEDIFKLINAYVNEGLSKSDLVRKMNLEIFDKIEELVKEQTNNLQERNQMLEAKILDWYAKSKDEKFAEHFGIKEASDGRV